MHAMPSVALLIPASRHAPFQTKKPRTYRHNDTRQTDIRAQSLTDPRGLPYGANEIVLLVAVDDAGEDVVRIRSSADCEKDDEEERLEVEEGCLWRCK
jgi:hypothetical protein